jgi:hypothetical protein
MHAALLLYLMPHCIACTEQAPRDICIGVHG